MGLSPERSAPGISGVADRLRPTSATEAFVAQVHLVQAWRRFPFLDPALPPRRADHDWPGPAAAKVLHNCHEHWRPQAQQRWDDWETECQ